MKLSYRFYDVHGKEIIINDNEWHFLVSNDTCYLIKIMEGHQI